MPIVKLPNRALLYFCHVPKCAGSTIEAYLKNRFGPLGFLDEQFLRRSPSEAWTMSPPQHIPEAVRQDLLPNNLFEATFATVRHPATRLRSVFLFQRHVEMAIPLKMPFPKWVEAIPRMLATDPFALNGHIRPMSETVPQDAKVFKMEQGLDDLVEWLDDTSESQAPEIEMGRKNVTQDRISPPAGNKGAELKVGLGKDILRRISDIYATDYDRFGYSVSPPVVPSAHTSKGSS